MVLCRDFMEGRENVKEKKEDKEEKKLNLFTVTLSFSFPW